MLFSAYKSYKYTADYYSYVELISADGTVIEKRYSTIPVEIKTSVSTNFIGDLILMTKQKLQIAGKIANVRDKNGNEIYENGVWEIDQTMPITSPVGLVEGYKYRAVIISGEV
jgi:hypothetical protein